MPKHQTLTINFDPGFQPNDLDSSPGHSLDGSFRKSRSGLYMFSSLYSIQYSPNLANAFYIMFSVLYIL